MWMVYEIDSWKKVKIVLGKSLFIGKNYPHCTCIALKKVVQPNFLKPDPNQESTGTPPTEQGSIRAESRPEIFKQRLKRDKV